MDMSASDGSAAALPSGPESGTGSERKRDALGRLNKACMWAFEHDKLLRHLIEVLRKSYAQAAREINERFGTSYSRNSAIGRGHRLELVGNPTGINTGDRVLRKLNREARRRERRANARAALLGNPRRPLPYLARCVAVEPLGITFDMMASDPNACKWPGEEYPYTYCGHPREDGRPYCPAHCMIGVQDNPRTRKERPGQVYALRRHIAASTILQSSLMDDPDA